MILPEGINKRFSNSFISIVIWLTVRHSNHKHTSQLQSTQNMKNKCLQFRIKGNRAFPFHPEIRELRNKKVLLFAQGYVTTTLHSEKRPTEMSVMHYRENMHDKVSSNSGNYSEKVFCKKLLQLRYIHMRHERTTIMTAMYKSI